MCFDGQHETEEEIKKEFFSKLGKEVFRAAVLSTVTVLVKVLADALTPSSTTRRYDDYPE